MATNLMKSPLGGMIGDFEEFEAERAQSPQGQSSAAPNPFFSAFLSAPADLLDPASKMATDLAKDSADSLIDLGKTILGVGEKKFSPKGSIDNFQNPTPEQTKKQQEAQVKRNFYASLEESRRNAQGMNQQKAIEQAVRMEVAAMSVTDKLDTLHLSLDLDEKHIQDPYHINELRRKKIEQIKEAKKQKESQELIAVTKNGNLLLNQNAQEGQSMTSSSGAIVSAG